MVKRVQDLDIETHLETAVNQLIVKDGKIEGAYAKGPDGVVQYNAKAVVFATGGFGGNPELIAQQGWDATNLFIAGSDKAAGDVYRMAMDAGAQDFMIDTAQSILFNIPALPPIDFHNDAMNPINGYFGIAHGGPVLWVNDGNMLYRHVYTINIGGTAFGNQVNSGREAAQNAAAYIKS